MSKALYRKYRSKSLSEVVGQGHITDILSRSLKEGKVAHAYLFTGPRGVGKTSIARIMAHEINQLPYDEDSQHLDIIEIDAASNNGVEDIRDLRERVQLAPVSAAKKVYIIDEVHMLSKAAFNALLKTLEEPPEHIVFILATTDADKLPDTIVSRTQRFNFRTIPTSEVATHLSWIAEKEKFTVHPDALTLIALHGEGSFRDSISLLDQLRGAITTESGITKELVESFLGLPPIELVNKLLTAYETRDLASSITLLSEAENAGAQPIVIASELIRVIKAMVLEKPHLLPLLDGLLEVARSSRPDIKLLTVLAAHNSNPPVEPPAVTTKPKTVALASRAPVISAPVIPEQTVAPEQPPAPPKKKKTPAQTIPFDWDAALKHIQSSDIALFAVASKCSPVAESDTLTFFTGNAFYKKKLDAPRYRTSLVTLLEELGMNNFTIETIGTAAPPKDELAASVAALMGGGEEYSIEETESGA